MVKISPLSCASEGTLSESTASVSSQGQMESKPFTQKIVFQVEMTPIAP